MKCKEDIDNAFSRMMEKDQAELEESMKTYFRGYWPDLSTEEGRNTLMTFTPFAIMRLARHFQEIGRNKSITDSPELTKAAVQAHIRLEEENGDELYSRVAFVRGAQWQQQRDKGEFIKLSYKPTDWYLTNDEEYMCGVQFEEPISADIELYYKNK